MSQLSLTNSHFDMSSVASILSWSCWEQIISVFTHAVGWIVIGIGHHKRGFIKWFGASTLFGVAAD